MKKYLALLLALCMVVSLCACGSSATPAATAAPAAESTAPVEEPAAEESNAMSYAEYVAAAVDSEVVIEAYVQNTQTWWEGKASFYMADEDGAYFVYNMACTEEEYAQISVPGTKLRVTGYRAEWGGEIEIAEGASFEVLEGSYIAAAVNVTDSLDALASYMNQLVEFDGMTVTAMSYKNYQPGDDIYVTMAKNGVSYEFCVEAYCATTTPDSELYAQVGELQVGDVVNVTGYLYWYYGPDAHIQSIEVLDNINTKSEGVMTYAEYAEAAVDTEVVIEAYVQNTQTWWNGEATLYMADAEGAYFVYKLACTEEEYAQFSVPGTKLRITGYKSEWSGEVEIVDATFEVLEGSYIAPAVNVTWSLDSLESYMNRLVEIDELTVEAIAYKNDAPGDDIYVTFSKDGVTYDFCVEAYCATTTADSELYALIGTLQAGDVVNITGYLYWYNAPNAHIQSVVAAG